MQHHGILMLLAMAACGDGGGGTIEKYEGSASVGGKAAKIVSCKVLEVAKEKPAEWQGHWSGKEKQTEIGLDSGHVIYPDWLDWRVRKDGNEVKVECSRGESDSMGGRRPAPWDKGEWHLTCAHPDGEIVLDVTYDCGSSDRPAMP